MANYRYNAQGGYQAQNQNYGQQAYSQPYQQAANNYQPQNQPNSYQAPANQGGYQNQQPAQQNNGQGQRRNNQRYSFFDAVRSLDNQGQTGIFAVAEGAISNVQQARVTQSNNKVLTFSMAVDGRSESIQRLTNAMPDTDQNGRTWMRVNVWNLMADRFEKYRASHANGSVITVTGFLSIDQYTDRNGRQHVEANLNCRNWNHVRDLQPRNNQAKPAQAPAQQYQATPASAPAQQNQGYQTQNPAPAGQYQAQGSPAPTPAANQGSYAGYNPAPAGQYQAAPAPAPAPMPAPAPAAPAPAPAPAAPATPAPAPVQNAAAPSDVPPFYDGSNPFDMDESNPFSMENLAGLDAGFAVD